MMKKMAFFIDYSASYGYKIVNYVLKIVKKRDFLRIHLKNFTFPQTSFIQSIQINCNE